MKSLTVIATIFIPLTFLAGIYGMNFEHMPELAVRWAYPATLLIMLALGLGMYLYMRRKKWF
jgi:magnesium transporter